NIYLRDNVYIIDHDHEGVKIPKPFTIKGKENKIIYKNNHPFFKTNVISYSSFKNGKMDVFYDAVTYILLGYRENNKDFVRVKNFDAKIIIKYSIAHKLKNFGFTSQYLNINNELEKYRLENVENIPDDSTLIK